MLRVHFILKRNKWNRIQIQFRVYKKKILIFFFLFFVNCKLDETYRNFFILTLFFNSSNGGVFRFFVDILSIRSGSVDLHIFADQVMTLNNPMIMRHSNCVVLTDPFNLVKWVKSKTQILQFYRLHIPVSYSHCTICVNVTLKVIFQF